MKEDKSQVNDRKETNNERAIEIWYKWIGSVCKVRTQDPENFDEEVKSLVTAWKT